MPGWNPHGRERFISFSLGWEIIAMDSPATLTRHRPTEGEIQSVNRTPPAGLVQGDVRLLLGPTFRARDRMRLRVRMRTRSIWVWVKMKPPGTCRFLCRFLLTRVPFWVPVFDPQPFPAIDSLLEVFPELSDRRRHQICGHGPQKAPGLNPRKSRNGRQGELEHHHKWVAQVMQMLLMGHEGPTYVLASCLVGKVTEDPLKKPAPGYQTSLSLPIPHQVHLRAFKAHTVGRYLPKRDDLASETARRSCSAGVLDPGQGWTHDRTSPGSDPWQHPKLPRFCVGQVKNPPLQGGSHCPQRNNLQDPLIHKCLLELS